MYITRLASKEIFSPSNKIHREVGRAKDLSAHRYSGDSLPMFRYNLSVPSSRPKEYKKKAFNGQ